MLKRLSAAILNLVAGSVIGLLLLEGVLQINPALLLRGMGLPAPVDPPLTTQTYTVRYSDADLFYWHSNLIRPVPPEQDRIEAVVTFQTDEFGFSNAAPLPARAEVVVLGRSYSLGLQSAAPWPRLLAAQTGQTVVNLAQAAAGINLKRAYYRRFGLPRHPRWLIVEVLPSQDILGYAPGNRVLVPQLPVPLLRSALDWLGRGAGTQPANYIYPLPVTLPAGEADLTFFSEYVSALTVDAPALAASQDWRAYQQGLLALAAEARAQAACVVLLYAPTKEEV